MHADQVSSVPERSDSEVNHDWLGAGVVDEPKEDRISPHAVSDERTGLEQNRDECLNRERSKQASLARGYLAGIAVIERLDYFGDARSGHCWCP